MASGRGWEQKEALHIAEPPLSFGDYAPDAGVRSPSPPNQNATNVHPLHTLPFHCRRQREARLTQQWRGHHRPHRAGARRHRSLGGGGTLGCVAPRAEAAQSLAATFLNLPDTRWAAAAVGLALALIAVNFMVDQIGPLT